MAFVKRKKIRLEGYDYSSCGAYFITICVADRNRLLWQNAEADYDRKRAEATRMNRLYYRAPEPSLRTKFKN